MEHASVLYTMGDWTVRPGNERAFIAEWERFARWTARTQRGAEKGILLRDTEHPEHFISLGPWKSEEAIRLWRDSTEFKTFAANVRELCSEFQPRSLSLVASSEEGVD